MTDQVMRRGDLVIDTDKMIVTRAGMALDLTPTEFELAAALARRPGRVFTRAQLLDAVRGTEVESFERAIDAHIKNIRAKLRQADLRGSQISGLNLAVLADYAGLVISESEQSEILRQLGVDVRPE